MKWSHLALRDQPMKGGVYIIIVSAPGRTQKCSRRHQAPPSPQPPVESLGWGQAALAFLSDLGGGLVSPWSHPRSWGGWRVAASRETFPGDT